MDFSKVLDGIGKIAEDKIKTEPDDYIKDGLLYCGKCGHRKQRRMTIMGEEKIFKVMCQCATEKYEKEKRAKEISDMETDYEYFKKCGEAEKDDFILLSWIDKHKYNDCKRLVDERKRLLQRICFSDSKMKEWNFANDDGANPKIRNIMQNYADNFGKMSENGKGLLLFGTVGAGKSYAAACVANELIDKGVSVLMTNFATIVNKVQQSFDNRQEYYDRLNRFQLLIIDDLSAERKTEYMQEIVFNVIDNRYRAGLPLIVTTNLTSDEIKHPKDLTNQRIFSRILEMCLPIELTGTDRRRERLKSDYTEYAKLLGL